MLILKILRTYDNDKRIDSIFNFSDLSQRFCFSDAQDYSHIKAHGKLISLFLVNKTVFLIALCILNFFVNVVSSLVSKSL